jgi:surfeit locus 1 family protein
LAGSRLAATAVALPAIAMLVGLGTWQVQRLHWKEDLIATMTSRMGAPAMPLADALALPGDQQPWRHVAVSGRFLNDREIQMYRTSPDGDAGYQVLTPLEEDSGETVLVERGWVPLELRDPRSRPGSEADGEVTVTGILQPGETPGPFTADNDPAKGDWYWIDLPAVEQATDTHLLPVVVHADAGATDGWPAGGQMDYDPPNNHLQYALTWYGLAVAAAVIYVRLMLTRGPRRRSPG